MPDLGKIQRIGPDLS